MVALTGRNEAYYTDYLGTPQEFISSVKYGYLYQGQRYKWQKKRRGTPGLDLQSRRHGHLHPEPRSNSQLRVWPALRQADFARQTARHHRSAAAWARHSDAVSRPGIRRLEPVPLLCRSRLPSSPNKFARAAPSFWRNFRASRRLKCGSALPIPAIPPPSSAASWIIPSARRIARSTICTAICCDCAATSRYFARNSGTAWTVPCSLRRPLCCAFLATECCEDDRLLLVNLGIDLHLDPAPEPLLAPPADSGWIILWSSEDPQYGGTGTAPLDTPTRTGRTGRIPGHAAVVLKPQPTYD